MSITPKGMLGTSKFVRYTVVYESSNLSLFQQMGLVLLCGKNLRNLYFSNGSDKFDNWKAKEDLTLSRLIDKEGSPNK